MKIMIDKKKPIGNGIITALNLNQARQRSDKLNNKKPKREAIRIAPNINISTMNIL